VKVLPLSSYHYLSVLFISSHTINIYIGVRRSSTRMSHFNSLLPSPPSPSFSPVHTGQPIIKDGFRIGHGYNQFSHLLPHQYLDSDRQYAYHLLDEEEEEEEDEPPSPPLSTISTSSSTSRASLNVLTTTNDPLHLTSQEEEEDLMVAANSIYSLRSMEISKEGERPMEEEEEEMEEAMRRRKDINLMSPSHNQPLSLDHDATNLDFSHPSSSSNLQLPVVKKEKTRKRRKRRKRSFSHKKNRTMQPTYQMLYEIEEQPPPPPSPVHGQQLYLDHPIAYNGKSQYKNVRASSYYNLPPPSSSSNLGPKKKRQRREMNQRIKYEFDNYLNNSRPFNPPPPVPAPLRGSRSSSRLKELHKKSISSSSS